MNRAVSEKARKPAARSRQEAGQASSAFPPEFDPVICRKRYPDLNAMSDAELAVHYDVHGRHEGRLVSKIVKRSSFLDLIDTRRPTLEIGPFGKPSVKGANVRYFDVLDREGLVARAEIHGVPPDEIPEIHYVSADGDLTIVDETFDAIVSCHCLEHQPDLVAHLNAAEAILSDTGHYFLVIPDKRYCFDHFLPESTIADVLQARHEGRRRHTLASVIEHRALTTHNEPKRHWAGDHGEPAVTVERVARALEEHRVANGGYVDVHAWKFTPQSFRTILAILHDMSLTRFRPVRVYDTVHGSNEFYAILEKQGDA